MGCEELGLQDSKVALRYGDGTALLDSLPESVQTQHIAGETLDIVIVLNIAQFKKLLHSFCTSWQKGLS